MKTSSIILEWDNQIHGTEKLREKNYDKKFIAAIEVAECEIEIDVISNEDISHDEVREIAQIAG